MLNEILAVHRKIYAGEPTVETFPKMVLPNTPNLVFTKASPKSPLVLAEEKHSIAPIIEEFSPMVQQEATTPPLKLEHMSEELEFYSRRYGGGTGW